VKRTLAAMAVIVVIASGCSNNKKATPPPASTAAPTTSQTTPIGFPPAVKLLPVMTFQSPTAMAQRYDDDGMYVAERAGRVRVLRNGIVGASPVLDISDEVSTDGERGLLGLTFAPHSHSFYVYYTDKSGAIHITEFALGADDVVDMHTRRDLLTIPHSQNNNHNGGQLAFGPDGDLYIGVGDGGGAGDPDKNGQNLTVLLGKILRINPTATVNTPYTIPYDNPFAKQTGARGEIWAYGLRNPWRFSFDTGGGASPVDNGIWIGDVGQDKWEEIDHVGADPKGGENYGWSIREGTHKYTGDKPTGEVDPVYEYNHDGGSCSVIGGYVYRGKAIEGMQGRYLFADYCTGALSTLTQKGTAWNMDPLKVSLAHIEAFGQDHKGELYVMNTDGQLSQIVAA